MKNIGNLILKTTIGFFGLIAVIVVFAVIFGGNNPTPPAQVATSSFVNPGEDGYLKLKATTDPDQIICLGDTKESYQEVSKSIMSKDYQGLLENRGAFCVGNGTMVRVIDFSSGLREVRIISTIRDIDKDKVGRRGWTATEFVLK